jgi:hypothetical protein
VVEADGGCLLLHLLGPQLPAGGECALSSQSPEQDLEQLDLELALVEDATHDAEQP